MIKKMICMEKNLNQNELCLQENQWICMEFKKCKIFDWKKQQLINIDDKKKLDRKKLE